MTPFPGKRGEWRELPEPGPASPGRARMGWRQRWVRAALWHSDHHAGTLWLFRSHVPLYRPLCLCTELTAAAAAAAVCPRAAPETL